MRKTDEKFIFKMKIGALIWLWTLQFWALDITKLSEPTYFVTSYFPQIPAIQSRINTPSLVEEFCTSIFITICLTQMLYTSCLCTSVPHDRTGILFTPIQSIGHISKITSLQMLSSDTML